MTHMSSTPGKTEYRMAYSDRNSVEEFSGSQADARRIQNILFGHGRAGDYDLGIDIQSYLHEINDSTLISEIRDKIINQIAKYCPDVNVIEVAVDTLDAANDPSGRANTTLIIGISLGTNTGIPYDFAVVARKDVKGNVISTLTL